MFASPRLIRAALLLVYAASGALALVYEIAWARRLALVFGSTHLAAATGLVAFIGGLALGARLFSDRVSRVRRPLVFYAVAELLIGLFGLASPWILDGVQLFYLATWPDETGSGVLFVLWRFAIVAATLVVPTALMGATVPAMTRVFAELGHAGSTAFGLPLGANTAGALAGTLLAGFVLLPRLGLATTLVAAGACNVLLGALAWALAGLARAPAAGPRLERPMTGSVSGPPAGSRLVILAAAVTGACGLGLEIAWTRLLALVLGSTAYAFTLMLSAYLSGLAIGTLVAAWLAERVRSPLRALSWVLIAFAATTWAGLFFANDLPFWFLELFRKLGDAPGSVMLAQATIAAIVMLVPATASGTVLPFVVRGLGRAGAPAALGARVYAVNTAAGIVAVILVTFVLIPAVSLRVTMMIAACVLAVAGMLLAAAAPGGGRSKAAAAAAVLAVVTAVIVLTPAFRPALFATAVYRYADRYRSLSRAEFEAVRNPDTSPVLYDEDGFVARVTVVGPAEDPALLLDGKGASAGGDVPTEILLAQLPILAAEKPRRALVIGHGAGVTTGSVLVHETIEQVVSIELERKVLACAPLFRALSAPDPRDPRLVLVANDGRNFLLASSQAFDVICSQPSNPWVSGAAPLFTAEAYRAGARRLADGGVFCQWLQTYEMSDENLRILVRTFAGEFPHAALFTSTVQGNVFLLGSKKPIRIDRNRLEDTAKGHLGVQMRRARLEAPVALLGLFCFKDGDLRAYAGEGRVNTDDNALIEFALPFDLFTNRVSELHASLRRASRGLPSLVAFPEGITPESRAADWENWGISFETSRRMELSREAREEAKRLR